MREKPLLAIIGAGWVIERAYLSHLRELARVIFVYDQDVHRADVLASRLGAARARDFHDCLDKDVEGIIVAVPPGVHEHLLPVVLASGKFVLCEKPVFRSLASAATASQWSERLMGSATTRLRADVQQMLRWVSIGRLGRIKRVKLGWWRGQGVPAPGSWRTDIAHAPGGVLDDLGPHLLDIATALLQADDLLEVVTADIANSACTRPESAAWFEAVGSNNNCTAPDRASAVLRSASGIQLEIHLSWNDGNRGDLSRVVIEGSDGIASLEGLFGFSTQLRVPTQRCFISTGKSQGHVVEFTPGPNLQEAAFGAMLTRFLSFCRGDALPIASFVEMRRVALWLEDIRARAMQ